MNILKKEQLEKKRLLKIIKNWAGKNKKAFWKYEVSCFHKTYTIRVANLPEPSITDILISSNNRLIDNKQKNDLCNAITIECAKSEMLSDRYIDVQIDYIDGTIIAEVI